MDTVRGLESLLISDVTDLEAVREQRSAHDAAANATQKMLCVTETAPLTACPDFP